LDELRNAIAKLPTSDRLKLLQEIASGPLAEQTLDAARRIRSRFCLKPKQQKRLSELLARNSEGEIDESERRELDALVVQVERNMLGMAQELLRASDSQRQADSVRKA
jgi:hypothetical protein